MAVYVLAGGAWLGGWCWRPVTRRLRDGGHEVYPATLTGLGERSHLASGDVDLETHITDVVNLIEYEDLQEVVLVGHSYAGIVVTGVADRIGDRLSHLVYLDSGPVPDGTSFMEMQSPEARRYIEERVEDDRRLPLPSPEELETVFEASIEGMDERALRLMRERATPQPYGTYTQPLELRSGRASSVEKKVLISNTFPLDQIQALISAEHPWFRELAGPEWRILELTTGHWPMFSRPEDLADMLANLPA